MYRSGSQGKTGNHITQEDLKDQLAIVNDDLKKAQIELAVQVGRVQSLKEMLEEKEKRLLALSAPESKTEVLQAQNADLRAEREK